MYTIFPLGLLYPEHHTNTRKISWWKFAADSVTRMFEKKTHRKTIICRPEFMADNNKRVPWQITIWMSEKCANSFKILGCIFFDKKFTNSNPFANLSLYSVIKKNLYQNSVARFFYLNFLSCVQPTSYSKIFRIIELDFNFSVDTFEFDGNPTLPYLWTFTKKSGWLIFSICRVRMF